MTLIKLKKERASKKLPFPRYSISGNRLSGDIKSEADIYTTYTVAIWRYQDDKTKDFR